VRAVFLLVFLSGATWAVAQEQERRLWDRLQNPDMTKESPIKPKPFNSDSVSANPGNPVRAGVVQVRESSMANRDAATKSFLGIKNPWFGNTVFDTGSSSLASREAREAVKDFAVGEPAAARAFPFSKPAANEKKPEVATSAFAGRGTAQGSLDQITDKIKKEMTVDEIRDLLNKSR
jgi:hypothetical protein